MLSAARELSVCCFRLYALLAHFIGRDIAEAPLNRMVAGLIIECVLAQR
jgi:hypothetical protein